jgi:hypothetical protein
VIENVACEFPVLDYLLVAGGLALVGGLWTLAEAIGSNVKCRVRGYHEWQTQLSDWGDVVYHHKVCRICDAIDFDPEGTPKSPPPTKPSPSAFIAEEAWARFAEWTHDRSVAEYAENFDNCWYCSMHMELHTREAIEAGYAIFTRFLTSTTDEYDAYILTDESNPTKRIHNDGVAWEEFGKYPLRAAKSRNEVESNIGPAQ